MSELLVSEPLVVVGVGGGIAAYKACALVRRLREFGYRVQVMPTPASLHFVGRATWEALSGRPAPATVWESVAQVSHVAQGKSAAAVIVAPATADLLSRAAAGQADDLLTSTLLATRAPVIFAPAMHTEMWEHPATAHNVAVLRQRGAVVVEPDSGALTGADVGAGRLPDPEALAALVRAAVERHGTGLDLSGLRVVISAGGTREEIDPVRFVGNRSSGRQGLALAAAAICRGARVTVVAADVDIPEPAGAKTVRVRSAEQLRDAVLAAAVTADVVIMAAAVADFRPVTQNSTKIKKESPDDRPNIQLTQTVDILRELGHRGGAQWPRNAAGERQTIVGFAAETVDDDDSLARLALAKLKTKRADLIVANKVGGGRGFETPDNEVLLVSTVTAVSGATSVSRASASIDLGGPQPEVSVSRVGPLSKEGVANAVWDEVLRLRADGAVGDSG